MRVLLINPPLENMISNNLPSFVEEERGFNPPLGILYIAACGELYTDHKIEVLDCGVEGITQSKLESEIKRRKPDLVGITGTTFTIIDTILLSKAVKRAYPDVPVVLGGPHVNIFPEETIKLPSIDYLVLGEGEIPFTALLRYIDNRKKHKKIQGLVYKEKNKVINTGTRPLIDNLDSIPFPARHLTPYKKYSSLISKRSPITTMMTSRGCPYNCLFCDRPHLGKLFRARSAENVVGEMEECVDMGINELLIYDDTFTIDRQRVIDVCNLIKERNLEIGWDIRARVNTVDKDLLLKLKSAGCERIHYGVESGNQEILNVLRKAITLEQVKNAFKWTKEADIETLAYFMIGSPRETKKEILQTIDFAKELNPDYVHFSVTTPFPATDLYYMGLNEGRFGDFWRTFAENPTPEFQPGLWEEHLTREELIVLLKHAYKQFYIRPLYILNKLTSMKTKEEFQKKFKAGLRLMKL